MKIIFYHARQEILCYIICVNDITSSFETHQSAHPFGGYRPVSPFVMVIFGATGDLTARKLMPALYNLLKQKILADRFFVVGFARRELNHEEFRLLVRDSLIKNIKMENIDPGIWKRLSSNLYYQQGFFEDKKPYGSLIKLLQSFDREIGACITRFFYLATPPQNYSTILTMLSKSKLAEGCGQGSDRWTRVLIEKPFGKDLATAKKLEEQLSTTFEEKQIYRIDHYLAKETIQNILAFRFANNLFEPIWNRGQIDNIQITLLESAGIGNRVKFYEGVGALRDVAQNHLMAMLAYTAMDEPKSLSAADIRVQRAAVISKIHQLKEDEVVQNVVRGQYSPAVIGGKQILGYRQEKDADPNSPTETYVAIKLYIDNARWEGVPFYLRTGKRIKTSSVRIDVQFKNQKSTIFQEFQNVTEAHANLLTIRVQPTEGISFRFFAKSPGLSLALEPVGMDFSYSKVFKKEIIDSYEKLLIDCMLADQTLFATGQGFKATWEFINAIMEAWKKQPIPKFPNYQAGSWGPKEAEELLQKDGRHWILH